MKYAFLFFALFFSITHSSKLHARTITSFNDSPALMTITQFMQDSAEDMATSNRISDKKLKVNGDAECVVVSAATVVREVHAAIKIVLRLFPDEELPIEEAMNDLSDYLGDHSYKKCNVVQTNQHKKIMVSYFFDSSDTRHIKVDTITLFLF